MVENPFKNIQLKDWPDFLLAISGVSFIVSLIALFGGSSFAAALVLVFGGFVLFGIGGKAAHYRFRDSSIKGNSNAWFSGWRHSLLADSLAGSGVLLIVAAVIWFCVRFVGT